MIYCRKNTQEALRVRNDLFTQILAQQMSPMKAEKLEKRFDPSLVVTDIEPGLCKAISL